MTTSWARGRRLAAAGRLDSNGRPPLCTLSPDDSHKYLPSRSRARNGRTVLDCHVLQVCTLKLVVSLDQLLDLEAKFLVSSVWHWPSGNRPGLEWLDHRSSNVRSGLRSQEGFQLYHLIYVERKAIMNRKTTSSPRRSRIAIVQRIALCISLRLSAITVAVSHAYS